MKPTRKTDLLLLAVGVGVCAWLIFRAAYDQFPTLRLFVPVTLAALAVIETVVAFQLRARNEHRRGAVVLEPLVAARAVALAKASSIVGAIFAGIWGGLLTYVVPRRDTVTAARSDTTVAIVGVVSSALLVLAALWLEHCCRTPERDDDDEIPPAPSDYDLRPPRNG